MTTITAVWDIEAPCRESLQGPLTVKRQLQRYFVVRLSGESEALGGEWYCSRLTERKRETADHSAQSPFRHAVDLMPLA